MRAQVGEVTPRTSPALMKEERRAGDVFDGKSLTN